MTRLQDDIIYIYNTLTDFSRNTLLRPRQLPIRVSFSESLNSLCFEQRGLKVSLPVLNYYCLSLKFLKNTYLLPSDYDKMMDSFSQVISSGSLLHDRVCLAPEEYGFSIYDTPNRTVTLKEGPQLLCRIRLVSGNSWLFKKITTLKYERI